MYVCMCVCMYVCICMCVYNMYVPFFFHERVKFQDFQFYFVHLTTT